MMTEVGGFIDELMPKNTFMTDVEAIVDDLLRPVRCAEPSRDSQREAFEQLQTVLLTTKELNRTIRERIADAVLTKQGQSNPIVLYWVDTDTICDCLMACGQVVALGAAIRTLKSVSTIFSDHTTNHADDHGRQTRYPQHRGMDPKYDGNGKDTEDTAFLTAEISLCLLRRILCTREVTRLAHHGDGKTTDSFFTMSPDFTDRHATTTLRGDENFKWREDCTRWVNVILLLPGIVANACRTIRQPIPSWSIPTKFYPRLVAYAMEMMIVQQPSDPVHTLYVESLIRGMVRRGGGDDVACGLYQTWERIRDPDVACGIIQTVVGNLSPREIAMVCRSLIGQCAGFLQSPTQTSAPHPMERCSHPWLDGTVRRLVMTNHPILGELLVEMLILSTNGIPQSPHEDWTLCWIISSIFAHQTESKKNTPHEDDDETGEDYSPPGPDTTLRRHLIRVAEEWCQESFVRHTDARSQRHVSFFLITGLLLLAEKTECATSDLVSALLRGVTERLSTTNHPTIRKDGMLLAELLAKRLGQELLFEEELTNVDRKWIDPSIMGSTGNEDSLENNPSSIVESTVTRRRCRRVVRHNQDPDAEYTSDAEGSLQDDEKSRYSDDSDWEDDTTLWTPYDVADDEEDLMDTPKPFYLADCLDLLRTPESDDHAYSRQSTALRELSDLVRARPIDLPDLASPLAFELLRLENKHDMPNFQAFVESALRSLAVEEPLTVGELLIHEIFQDMSLGDRLLAMQTLCDAAMELSGIDAILDLATNSGQLTTGCAARTEESLQKIEHFKPQTRQGKPRLRGTAVKAVTKSNPFVRIAPAWFYLLVANFIQRKETQRLWSGSAGATFLSRIFHTLATFVECCRRLPGSNVMAKDLVQLVWIFRNADVSEVRMSVLLAVATSFPLLHDDVALQLVLDQSGDSLGRILPLMADGDPDETCRSLARVLASNVAATLRSIRGDLIS